MVFWILLSICVIAALRTVSYVELCLRINPSNLREKYEVKDLAVDMQAAK